MDFYKELLESFSRVKGRKLQLLEEEGLDPEVQATKLKDTAIANKAPFSNPATVVASNGKKIGVYIKASGNKSPIGGLVDSNGGVNNRHSSDLTTPDGWAEFVGLFGEGGESKTGFQKDVPGGQGIPKTPEETKLNQRRIVGQELRETLTKVAENAGGDGLELLDTLTGRGTNLTWSEDGGYILQTGKKVNEEATETLADLIKEYQDAEEGSMNPAQNSDFKCGQFKLYDGNVILFPDSGPASKGYVVSKSPGTSDYLRKLYDSKTECPDLEEVTGTKSSGSRTGTESNLRGNLFEPVTSIFCLQKFVDNNPNMDAETRDKMFLMGMIIYDQLKTDIGQLDEAVEVWIAMGNAAMLPAEDIEEIENMVELMTGQALVFGPRTREQTRDRKYLKAMFVATRASNVLRDPDMSIRVGSEVEQGKKQDQIDMWNSRQEAMEARARTFGPGKLKDAPTVGKKKAKDIFKDKELLDQYIETKQIQSEDQELFYTKVSLKSLMQERPEGHTTGTTTIQQFLGFLEGKGALRTQFDGTGPVGRKPRDLLSVPDTKTEFDRIAREQRIIDTAVNNLSFDSSVKTANGKTIKGVDSLGIQVDAVLSDLSSELSWRELNVHPDRSAFNSLVTRHKNATTRGNTTLMASIEKELKDKLRAFMLKKHMDITIQRTLNDKNKSDETKKGALLVAAAHTYKAGASDDDQAVVQKNYLVSRKSYFSAHNGPFKSMLRSISEFESNDDGSPKFKDWRLNTSTGSRWTKTGPPRGRSLSTTMSEEGVVCNQSGALTIEESTIHDFEPDQSDPSLKDSTIINSLDTIQEALGLLKEKMKLR